MASQDSDRFLTRSLIITSSGKNPAGSSIVFQSPLDKIVDVSDVTKTFNWSHAIIQDLLNVGKESNCWFILPKPNPVTFKDEAVSKFFLTSLLPNDKINDFSINLYHGKSKKESSYEFIKTTFQLRNGQISERRIEGNNFLFINFCANPQSLSLRNVFESTGFQYPAWPPTWASASIRQASYWRQFDVNTSLPPLKEIDPSMDNSSLYTAHDNSDKGFMTMHNDNTPKFSNIPLIISPDHMSTLSTESKRGFNESLEQDDLLGCMDYGVLQREYLRLLALNEEYEKLLLDHVDDHCMPTSLLHRSMKRFQDDDDILDGVDDAKLQRLILKRLKINDDFFNFLPDTWFLSTIVKRSKFGLSSLIESRLNSGRIHYEQSIKIMAKKRLSEFRVIAKVFIEALIKMFHPVPEDSPADILKDIFGLQHESNIHIEHSKAIFESMRLWSPKERIAQMSYLTTVTTRGEAAKLLSAGSISKYEWTEARRHAKSPGVGQAPIKVMYRRCRLSDQALQDFFEVLSDSLQRYSFGTAVAELTEGGKLERIERVKTTKKFIQIFHEYMRKILPFLAAFVELSEEEDDDGKESERADGEQEDASRLSKHEQGLRNVEGESRTGKMISRPYSYLSKTTCRRLVNRLTAGQIKSLAGLDDEDAEKGRKNWIRLQSLASRLIDLCPDAKDTTQDIRRLIDEAEAFHVTDFIPHIKNGDPTFTCCCLPCGFRTEEDPIDCQCLHLHQGVCSSCAQSFSVFPKIEALICKVEQKNANSTHLKDEIPSFWKQVRICRQNLIDYRAHLVLKYDEKEGDKEELSNLKSHQAIVVSDWKMKILQAFHRETQQEFYGKRGTSLLGFMVIYCNQTAEGNISDEKEVVFHFCFTDDTTQDNTSVNAAKCLIYREFLPIHVTEVLFRADGAGCFSSNMTKASIVNWKAWTGKDEVSNRQSPVGGGKTNLDGAFGVFSRNLSDRVDEGCDIFGSDSILDAVQNSSLMRSTNYHIYSPGRENCLNTKLKDLNQHYKIIKCEGGINLLKHSRWSVGKFISLEEIRKKWIYDDEAGDDPKSNEELSTLSTYPPAPKYTKYRSLGNEAEEKSLLKKGDGHYLEIKENKIKEKISRNNQRLLEKQVQESDDKISSGLFPCNHCNKHQEKCLKDFTTQAKLDQHMNKGNHKYYSCSGMSVATRKAINEKGVLSAAIFNNRSQANPRDLKLKHAQVDKNVSQDWYGHGCYNKPKRKQATSMSDALKNDLLDIFNTGEKTKAKLSAENTLKLLKSLTVIVDGVIRLKYTDTVGNDSGPLPDVKQIKSFFSQESNRRKKGFLTTNSSDAAEDGYHKWTVPLLWAKVSKIGLLSLDATESKRLKAIMGLLMLQGVFEENDDNYMGWTNARLRGEIKRMFQEDVNTEKSQLVAILTISDSIGLEQEDTSTRVPSNLACPVNEPTTPTISETVPEKTEENEDLSCSTSLPLSGTANNDNVHESLQEMDPTNILGLNELQPLYKKWTVPLLWAKVSKIGLLSLDATESKRLKAIMGLLVLQGVFKETDDKYNGWKNDRLRGEIKRIFQEDVNTEKSQLVALLTISDSIGLEQEDTSTRVPSNLACPVNEPTMTTTISETIPMKTEDNEASSSCSASLPMSSAAGNDTVHESIQEMDPNNILSLNELQPIRGRELEGAPQRAESLLRPLTAIESKLVHNALYGEGKPQEVVARYKSKETGFFDTVQRESMRRLKPGKWLNDEVIHYSFTMLANRDAKMSQESPSRKRCHFFKSFFITKLLDEGKTNQYTYSNVKSWSKNVPGQDIFGLDMVFIPVNIGNAHWACLVIFVQERRIQFFDSLGGKGDNYMDAVMQYLKDEWESKNPGQEFPHSSDWKKVRTTTDTPKQQNGFDCGVFTCMFADFLSMGYPLSFTQEHITQCRERIALSILQGCAIR